MRETYSTDYIYIFRAYITLKDGTRIYARQRGKRAFCFAVPVKHVE